MSEINYNINLDYDPENEELAVILNNADNFCNALELADMLNETEENNLRKAIGQHFCPLHVNALYSTLPLPANDNNKPDDNAD